MLGCIDAQVITRFQATNIYITVATLFQCGRVGFGKEITQFRFHMTILLIESPVGANRSFLGFPTLIKGREIEVIYILLLRPVGEFLEVASLIVGIRSCLSRS